MKTLDTHGTGEQLHEVVLRLRPLQRRHDALHVPEARRDSEFEGSQSFSFESSLDHIIVATALPLRLATGDAPVHKIGVAPGGRLRVGVDARIPQIGFRGDGLRRLQSISTNRLHKFSEREDEADMRYVVVHEVAAVALELLIRTGPDIAQSSIFDDGRGGGHRRFRR